MNQGIIIEVNENHSVVLSEGLYYKIKNKKAMAIGMEMLFTEEDRMPSTSKSASKPLFKIASVAAAVVLVFMMSLVYYNNNLAVFAVVTMDINPSVEVSLNRDNEVLKVEAMNEDGKSLLDIDVDGLLIDEAIALLINEAKNKGFVKNDQDAFIVITAVSMKDEVQDRISEIESLVAEEVTQNSLLREITVAIVEGTLNELEQAKESKIPLALVTLQNKGKALGATKVKELKGDAEALQSMEDDGNLYKYGNSLDNRNDVFVFEEKLVTAMTTAAALNIEIPAELQDELDEATDLNDRKKAIKAIDKYIHKLTITDKEYEDEEPYDGGPLKAIIDKLNALMLIIPKTHSYVENPEEDIVEFVGRASEALKFRDKDEDKILRTEGRALIKALQKAGIKAPDGDEEESDEATVDSEDNDLEEDIGQPDEALPEEKTNNGKSDKDNNGNNVKKIKDVEEPEAVTEVVTEPEDIENSENVDVDENEDDKIKEDKEEKVKVDKVKEDKDK